MDKRNKDIPDEKKNRKKKEDIDNDHQTTPKL